MNSMRRLTGATAVVVGSGLALAAIVLVAALITDAVSTGNDGGSFPDRMSRIFGTDSVNEIHEEAMSEEGDTWDSEAWHEEIEAMRGDSSIPVYRIGEDWDCAIDLDADVEEIEALAEKGPVVIRCENATIFMKDPGSGDDWDHMYVEFDDDLDFDEEVSPFSEEDDPSGRLPGLTEELLEILLDSLADGDGDAYEFADEDDTWSEWDKEESYSDRESERWSEGPFTFEYGGPDGGEVFTFRFFDADGNESGGEPERFFFDEPWSEGPFTFSFRIPDDDHEYSFEMFDERWGKPDSWADDRFGFEGEWSKSPFSFRDWRDGGDGVEERRFPFGIFRDEWYSEEGNGEYEFDESFGEFSEEFGDLFTEGGEFSFEDEELSPEQEELMRRMMQRMMEMFGLEDLFPVDGFDFDDWESDPDDYNGDGDDEDDGAFWFHDSDSTARPARY